MALAKDKRELAVAIKLTSLFEGFEWQQYPNPNQKKFQSLMRNRARMILRIADSQYEDDPWEKKEDKKVE